MIAAYRLLVLDLVHAGVFTLQEFERASRFQFVKGVLELYHHNQSRAARAMGMHRNTLRRTIIEMKKAGMDPGRRQPKSGRPAITMGEKREKRSA
jgi:DNA-binding NtrC family response regulator